MACQRARGRGWAGFPRLQPHSLIVCDSLIVCAPAFSSPVGVEPLQRRYKALQAVTRALQSRYEPLRVVTQSLRSRYSSYEPLRSWAASKSLCLTAAFSPVPAFLGGSCPSGCSLSAPATGGLSMVSPQYIRYAAGSEKEKRAWGRLHGGTIAQSFVFCNGGGGISLTGDLVVASAVLQRRVCFGLRRCPARSALRRFWKQGDSPCTPGGGCAPCTPLGGTRGSCCGLRLLSGRVSDYLLDTNRHGA